MVRLRTPRNKSLQNKENIPPVFNYLAPAPERLPTLERPISPPPKSPRRSLVPPSPPTDRSAQTELSHQNDEAVQTNSVSAPDNLAEAYYDLTTRYDILRSELNTYKSAHEELQEKYLKNKKVWEAWIEKDTERREIVRDQLKKRKRDGSVMPETEKRQIVHGYTTPATSITDRYPYSRPPTLSPNKPIFTPAVSHTIPKRAGLFSDFRPSTGKTGVSNKLGTDIGTSKITKDVDIEAVAVHEERVLSESEGSDGGSWPSSVPETQAPPVTRKDLGSTPEFSPGDGTYGSTDGRNSESPIGDTAPTSNPPGPGVKESPALPDPAFKVPGVNQGKPDSKRTREGDSVVRPVVIKSEPSVASSEGLGYHLFEQESLDLDDIGYKPDTPRKRQRISDPLPEELASSGRVGWTNGGFMIKRAPGVEESQGPDGGIVIEETQDEDEGIMWGEEASVPMLPPLAMSYGEIEGLRTDSQLARPQTPLGAASAISIPMPKQNATPTQMKSSDNNATQDKENQPNHSNKGVSPSPLLRDRPLSRSNQSTNPTPVRSALSTVEEPASRRISPQKSHTRRRITSAEALAHITEDGTDGTDDVDNNGLFGHPPMTLSEKQMKKLEGLPKLSEMLNSPAPKTPSLAHLKRKPKASKSVPAKITLRKDLQKPKSSSEPPKRKAWIDPMRHTKGKQAKQGPHKHQSKLDISHFRVNPSVNEGKDYAFAETVRNREARKCLPGCVKACCKELSGFVEAAGLPAPAPRGPRWRSSSPPASSDAAREQEADEEALDKKFTTKFGKHRDAFTRRRSPPGFWDAGFPDTQDIERQHEAAEEMRLQKVEEMRKEAEKGAKGRYIYKS